MQPEASVLDSEQSAWLAAQQTAMVDLLCEWSNINSGSYHLSGIAKQRDALQAAFRTLDAKCEILPAAELSYTRDSGEADVFTAAPCLFYEKRANAPKQILLSGHMDTVFGSDHPFQTVKREGNILHGPGVADMKGGLVVMLYALKLLEQHPEAEQLGWRVIINADEEIGSLGSRAHLKTLAEKADFGFIFEPAMDDQGTLVSTRKGSGNFTVVARGVAAHVGRDFQAGRNAIVGLTHVIQALHALNGQRGAVTVNVGLIHGGTANNSVPDCAVARVDVRVQSDEDQAWVEANIENILKQSFVEGVEITIEGAFTRPPKVLDARGQALLNWVLSESEKLGMPLGVKPSGGCSDGNNLAAAGLANIDTLGVYGGGIHSDREYMLIDSLTKRAALTAHLLVQMAKGQGPTW